MLEQGIRKTISEIMRLVNPQALDHTVNIKNNSRKKKPFYEPV